MIVQSLFPNYPARCLSVLLIKRVTELDNSQKLTMGKKAKTAAKVLKAAERKIDKSQLPPPPPPPEEEVSEQIFGPGVQNDISDLNLRYNRHAILCLSSV